MAFSDILGLIPEDKPETCHPNFDPNWRGWLPPLLHPQRYNLAGNLEDIAPTTEFICTQTSLEPGPSAPEMSEETLKALMKIENLI